MNYFIQTKCLETGEVKNVMHFKSLSLAKILIEVIKADNGPNEYWVYDPNTDQVLHK